MFEKHKLPSMEAGLIIILLVISVFAIGLSTGERVTGMAATGITGNMVKVTGMGISWDEDTAFHKDTDTEATSQSLSNMEILDSYEDTTNNRVVYKVKIEGDTGLMWKSGDNYRIAKVEKDDTGNSAQELAADSNYKYGHRLVYDEIWDTPLSDKYDPADVATKLKSYDSDTGTATAAQTTQTAQSASTSEQPTPPPQATLTAQSTPRTLVASNGATWIRQDDGTYKLTSSTDDKKYIIGTYDPETGKITATTVSGYNNNIGDSFPVSAPTQTEIPKQTTAPTTQYKVVDNQVKESTDGTNWKNSEKTTHQLVQEGYTLGSDGKFTKAATTSSVTQDQFNKALSYLTTSATTPEIDIEQLDKLNLPSVDELRSINYEQIEKNAEIREALVNTGRTQENYKKVTIQLAEAMQKQEELMKQGKWEEAGAMQSEITRLTKTWKGAADAYETAYNNYDQKTYTVEKAFNDLDSTDSQTRQRAMNKLEEEYLNAKTEEEKAKILEKVYLNVQNPSPTTEQQLDEEKLYSKLLEIETGKALAAKLGATYNPKDGSFTKNGKTGWAFTSDGEIDTSVKRPVNTAEKEKLKTQYEDEIIKIHNQMHPYDPVERKDDGKLYDPNGNEVELRYNGIIKDTEILKRTPPKTISYNGIDQELTLLKDYKQINGEVLYQTKDGTIFSANTKWNDPDKKAFTGKISKIDLIGDEKDSNSVLIRNSFDVVNGKKQNNVASTSIVDKKAKDDPAKDIPIDKETLSMIIKTIGTKGSIDPTKDGKSATISFKNKDGQETSTITFSPRAGENGYKIEGNKLTQGIRSQTDFAYTLDKNNDGEITEGEKEAKEYSQLTARFTAFEEDQGELKTTWYADNFRFGSDDIYFTDLYMQLYEKDAKGRDIPKGEPEYYYVEGGEKGNEDAGKIEFKRDANGEIIAANDGTKVIKIKDGKAIDTSTGQEVQSEELRNRAINREKQSTSRRWFADFEFRLTQFKGLSGWSQLIFSDETLAEWREGVDKLFSSLYLGTEYWVSGICSKNIPKGQSGTFMMQTKDGLFDVVAHVEGEKTPITSPEGTQYLYKLTFSVRNPKYSRYENLDFNVYLYGTKTVQLYPQNIKVSDGDSFTRGSGTRNNGQVTYDKIHGKPVVQYSKNNYNKICIRFSPALINAEGKAQNEICNAIVPYTGSPTEYQEKIVGTTAVGTYSSTGDPYQEAQI